MYFSKDLFHDIKMVMTSCGKKNQKTSGKCNLSEEILVKVNLGI